MVTSLVPPIADPRSHTSAFGTLPNPEISSHIPDKMSPPCHEGIITAEMNREYPNTMTNTGSTRSCPPPTGIGVSGNRKSHCAIAPGL